MALLLHILIACTSLVFTVYMFLRPSATKLRISLGLIIATVGSGTLLVIAAPGHIMGACLMGLMYVGVTVVGTVMAQRKLATQGVRSRHVSLR